jgi:hypothetical protein
MFAARPAPDKHEFVMACDKREAFAQGSVSDEAIHSWFVALSGLLCGACHRARIRATRWLAMTAQTKTPGSGRRFRIVFAVAGRCRPAI